MTASERATLNFYHWEYRHRGYYHFDTPVDIEVPYLPFKHQNYSNVPIEDDGRVPSIFQSIGKLLNPSPKKEESYELEELKPRYLLPENAPELIGFSISFPKEQDILPRINTEFLNMLSYSEYPISFEIVGNSESITIQLVFDKSDRERIESHIKAYFPTVIVKDIDQSDFGFDNSRDVAIADFGINDEFVRPVATTDSFEIDPLTSVIATMDNLRPEDIVVFQTIFKGIASPLAKDITHAVGDGTGGSFFSDAPEMPGCARHKISNPLFSVVMRIATQGQDNQRSQYLAQELTRSISAVSSSEYNKLIPLSNEGYNYDFHFFNLNNRLSNRLGFILNSKELNTFVHFPNRTIVSQKLGLQFGKTKRVSQEFVNEKYAFGINSHNGNEHTVGLNDQARLRHTQIIGATGVGKSTLIANMIIEDMRHGNGCALFDPHGDIVEDVLARVPEHRLDDVVLIDPANLDYPTGFNLLHATTEAEKIVLSSDLVSAFKRYATAWGDNMSAVLQQAVNTFLESSRGGTLIELKRFLLEDRYRAEFLQSVDDPSIHYYWEHEYSMVKRGIAPLLTRIDTFLRPKTVRYMLAQTGGVDFRACIEDKKIVLIKLSQGLIGEDNSFLLGSLFLSKFNQVALGRQSLPKSERHPFYIYCDEFQNFVTNSITTILSSARKYGLGLILAHQELAQIDDAKVLNSVLSNPYVRICFRLGDVDAKRLESGFSYFEQSDLQSLGIGEAIVRIGSSNNDFNLGTKALDTIDVKNAQSKRTQIVKQTQEQYGTKCEDVEALLELLLPQRNKKPKKTKVTKPLNTVPTEIEPLVKPPQPTEVSNNTVVEEPIIESSDFEKQKQDYLETEQKKQVERKHSSLQNYIKTIAIQQGYKTVIEHALDNESRVDVSLTRDKVNIAIEISVTNSIGYEVQNIKKCLDAKYNFVVMVCDNETHLYNIKEKARAEISKKQHKQLHFINSSSFSELLIAISPKEKVVEKRIKGYRVKTSYSSQPNANTSSITKIIAQSLQRKK